MCVSSPDKTDPQPHVEFLMDVIRRLAVKMCDQDFQIISIRRIGWLNSNFMHIGGRIIDESFLKECCIDLSQYESLDLWAQVRLAPDESVHVTNFSMELRFRA